MPEPIARAYGIKELRTALRKLGTPDQMKELKAANQAAAQIIIDAAQGKASTRLERRAAATLKAANTQQAAIRLGGIPGALGAEFGAYHDQVRRGPSGVEFLGYNQFKDWAGNDDKAGYFLWPAIREKTPEVLELYADDLIVRFDRSTPPNMNGFGDLLGGVA